MPMRIVSMIIKAKVFILHALVLMFAALGAWMLLWNPVDFFTQGFDYGIWDTAILTNGVTSMFIGLIIVIIATIYFKVRVF